MTGTAGYEQRDAWYPWRVLFVTSLGVLLVLLNVGSLNVALPALTKHFHAGPEIANWILLSYMLVSTILILVFGQVSDVLGRRRLYLLGSAIFTVTSFAIGFSPNVWVLLALRILQAAGGALVITNNTALLTDAFPKRLLGTGLGINVLVASAAQLLGPVVGGFFVSISWEWVFWFNVPFGVVNLVFGIFTLRDSSREPSEHVDLQGAVVVFVALAGLIIALSEGGVLGWGNPLVLCGLLLFVILTPLFVWMERKSDSPMIDFRLFRNRPYAMANIATFLNFFAQTAVILLISLYFQVIFSEPPLQAGLKVLPSTLGMLVISPIAGRLSTKYSARLLSTTGLALSALGLVLMITLIGPSTPYPLLAVGMALVGIGSGLFLTPNTATIMSNVPANRRGIANGLRSMLNNMGQVCSTAVCLTIITAVLPPELKGVIYSGSSQVLEASDVAKILTGYRFAFLFLIIATVLGAAASWLRNKRPEKAGSC